MVGCRFLRCYGYRRVFIHDHPPDPGGSGTGGGQARPLRLRRRIHCMVHFVDPHTTQAMHTLLSRRWCCSGYDSGPRGYCVGSTARQQWAGLALGRDTTRHHRSPRIPSHSPPCCICPRAALSGWRGSSCRRADRRSPCSRRRARAAAPLPAAQPEPCLPSQPSQRCWRSSWILDKTNDAMPMSM